MLLSLTAGALVLTACGPPPPAPADGGTDVVSCRSDPRVEPWKPGLSRSSADGSVRLVVGASSPASGANPVRGSYTWSLRVLDANGQPVANPALAVKPWMPDHGHGTSVEASFTPDGKGGYTVGPLYLFMAGVWQLPFTVTPPSGTRELVTFGLCVAG